MGNPAQRKYADSVEFMESVGFRFDVVETVRRFELRQYVDQRPPVLRVGPVGHVGNLVQIDHTDAGWVLHGVSASVARHEPFERALDAFHWWVSEQPR